MLLRSIGQWTPRIALRSLRAMQAGLFSSSMGDGAVHFPYHRPAAQCPALSSAAGKKLGAGHLFFGCRNRKHDFIYEEELEAAVAQGAITQASKRQGAPGIGRCSCLGLGGNSAGVNALQTASMSRIGTNRVPWTLPMPSSHLCFPRTLPPYPCSCTPRSHETRSRRSMCSTTWRRTPTRCGPSCATQVRAAAPCCGLAWQRTSMLAVPPHTEKLCKCHHCIGMCAYGFTKPDITEPACAPMCSGWLLVRVRRC